METVVFQGRSVKMTCAQRIGKTGQLLRNKPSSYARLRQYAQRYLQGMTPQFKHTITILWIFFLIGAVTKSFACTCIGKDKQTTENELNFVDLAIKGKIISVTNFDYHDTVISFAGPMSDPKQAGYLIRKYKLFTLIVDYKYKATKNMADTIQVVTGYGGGDCGYEFEVGKEYIIYGEAWKEKYISVRHKKRKAKRRTLESVIPNKFYTDICRLTQDTNAKELENLKRLTQ
jgi:hypothetical protein